MAFSWAGAQRREERIRARQDGREAAVMDIFSKTGGIGLKKIFGSNFSNESAMEVASSNIDSDSLTDVSYSSTEEMGHALFLQKNYEMTDGALAKFAASGNPSVFKDIRDIMDKQQEKYGSAGLEVPPNVITDIVEKSVILGPGKSGKIDMGAIEKYVGRELDGMYKTLIEESGASAGTVSLFKPSYIETTTPTEIMKAIDLYTDGVRSNARVEQAKINAELNKLRAEKENTGTNDHDTAITLLSNRLSRISEIFDKKVENQPFAFADLYGNSWMKGFLKRNPKYKVEDFPTIYTHSINQYPQVSSEEMALALYAAGVFENNTIIQLPDGTTRELIP